MPPRHHGVAVFNGCYRTDRIGAAQIVPCSFRYSPIADFSFFHELVHSFRNRLRLYVWVNAMLIVQVDIVGFQPLQTALYTLTDGLRTAVQPQG